MADLLIGVRMTTATTGTGIITLGAAVSGYLTPALAGAVDGKAYLYGIKDGANSEWGIGTYTAAGTTLTRGPYKSTNSNAAISLSGTAEVYLTPLGADGGDLLPGTSNPMRGFDTPINLQLNASVASNILTIAVKGNNGNDPSNTNPVLIPFRDATLANGGPVWVALTAALSIDTNAVGATLGTANGVPFRLWVVAVNKAGTVELALWQSVTGGASPTGIAALNEASRVNTTNISGTATAAGTFYNKNGNSGSSNAAFRILGYVDYASGLTTAGTYGTAPTTVQLFGPGVCLPGRPIGNIVIGTTTSGATTTSTTYVATNLTASITPSSAPNLIRVKASGGLQTGTTAGSYGSIQMFRGTTALGLGVAAFYTSTGTGAWPVYTNDLDAPGVTSSTAYTLKMAAAGSGSVYFPTNSGASWIAGSGGRIELEEIMA